jgi:hypothetical protein
MKSLAILTLAFDILCGKIFLKYHLRFYSIIWKKIYVHVFGKTSMKVVRTDKITRGGPFVAFGP